MSIYCWKKWNLKSYKCKIHMDGENVKNAKKLNFQNLIQVIHHLWKHSYQHTNKYKMGICTVKLSPIMAYQIISNKIQKSFGHSHVHFNHIIFPMSNPNIDWYYIQSVAIKYHFASGERDINIYISVHNPTPFPSLYP